MKTIGPDLNSTKTSHNPFEAPHARVDDPGPRGGGALLDPPRTVGAGRGFGWLGEGWELFREAPGIWIGIIVVWMLITMLINMIPVVNFFASLISTVLVGGLMIGCHSLAQGRGLTFGHLFEGFQRNFGALVLVGLFLLLGAVVAFGSALLSVLGTSGAALLLNQDTSAAPEPMLILLSVLMMLALLLPLMMAFWFAPALVVLHDQPALRAMGLSFRGCLRNLLPFLAYGIGWLGLGILATIPLGLGWLALIPVGFTSTYAAYRDIFVD
jgi:hypothetical protein